MGQAPRVTLGFLAVARLIDDALWRGGNATERGRTLASLAVGIASFFVLWMVAALLGWAPLAATVVRAAALAATWAAVTLGAAGSAGRLGGDCVDIQHYRLGMEQVGC